MLPQHLKRLFTAYTGLVMGLIAGCAAFVLATSTPSSADKSCSYQNPVAAKELSNSLDREEAWLEYLQAAHASAGAPRFTTGSADADQPGTQVIVRHDVDSEEHSYSCTA